VSLVLYLLSTKYRINLQDYMAVITVTYTSMRNKNIDIIFGAHDVSLE